MKIVNQELWCKSYKVKNSRFKVFISQISNIKAAEEFLLNYHDNKATHNCYSYIIGFEDQLVKKFNDDKEPFKSAGFAILKVLEENKITNTIVLVQRYFKPPKLGLGSLMRAYQFGILEYLKNQKLLSIIPSKQYQLTCPINLINLIYQWQKQFHFDILEQKTINLKSIFIINIANQQNDLPYHLDVKITFIKNSFLVNHN